MAVIDLEHGAMTDENGNIAVVIGSMGFVFGPRTVFVRLMVHNGGAEADFRLMGQRRSYEEFEAARKRKRAAVGHYQGKIPPLAPGR